MNALLLALSLSAVAADLPPPRETVIRYAANGGIRDFAPGPKGSDIVYLQDRSMRWYAVTLTGPCVTNFALDSVMFRTDPDGNLDRFSTIASRRYPDRTCGVRSIMTSVAPPGYPAGAKHRR